MDISEKREAERLREMSSADAAEWLLRTYPTGGTGLRLLRHRSWLRADQDRLADHYLGRMPFAAAWPYEALLSVMSLRRFLRVTERHFPSDPTLRDLALYHLAPTLQHATKTEVDRAAVASFLAEKRPF